MKYIILCGGFGKRLHPLTLKTPKALIPLQGRRTNLDFILSNLTQVTTAAILVTNSIYAQQFSNFLKEKSYKIKLTFVIEPEQIKWGTTQTISYVIDHLKIKDDIMIISGDNFFEGSFAEMISFFKKNNKITIALYDGFTKNYITKRFGVAKLGEQGRIVAYQEKPSKPMTNIITTLIEIFPKRTLFCFKKFLKLYDPDLPIRGYFIKNTIPVYGYMLNSPWYDIGDFKSLKMLKKYLINKDNN